MIALHRTIVTRQVEDRSHLFPSVLSFKGSKQADQLANNNFLHVYVMLLYFCKIMHLLNKNYRWNSVCELKYVFDRVLMNFG